MPKKCPVCGSEAKIDDYTQDHLPFFIHKCDCLRCGKYVFTTSTESIFNKLNKNQKLGLSHWIRMQNEIGHEPNFYKDHAKYTESFFLEQQLPSITEQSDNLILYLGKFSKSLSEEQNYSENDLQKITAVVGCHKSNDLIIIFNHLKNIDLIDYYTLGGMTAFIGNSTVSLKISHRIKLTFTGWQKYEELKNGKPESKHNTVESMLGPYPKALGAYKSALDKYEKQIYQRNILDDLRLCLELLLKEILQSKKSLENQKEILGKFMKDKGSAPALRSSFQTLINHFAQYQNDHVKHDDAVNPEEIELVKDQVDSFIKHLIKLSEKE